MSDLGPPIINFVNDLNTISKIYPDSSKDHYTDIKYDYGQRRGIPNANIKIDNVSDLMAQRLSTGITSSIGPEVFIDSANNFYKQTKSDKFKTIIDKLFANIIPDVSENILHDLEDLYKNIKFEEYKLNETMQKEDENILKDILGNPKQAGKILDSGCGTGRLLIPLHEAGYNIEGIDLSQRHLDVIHDEYPGLKAIKEDWTDLKNISDKQYNSIFSLGRNILHEYTPDRQRKMFEETNRILRKGGKYIFDIPDPKKGQYDNLIKSFRKITQEKNHIAGFRKNTIYDSPDGKNFFFRYAYSHEDIANLANDNGFKIIDIKETPLETGKGDIDRYYVLEKIADIAK